MVASAVSGPTLPASMKQEGIEAFKALSEVLTGELSIPVLFTPAQAQSKVQDAWTASVERKALKEERKNDSPGAPDGQDRNDSSAKGKPINTGSQGSANTQSGKPDDNGNSNGGPNASVTGDPTSLTIRIKATAAPMRRGTRISWFPLTQMPSPTSLTDPANPIRLTSLAMKTMKTDHPNLQTRLNRSGYWASRKAKPPHWCVKGSHCRSFWRLPGS